MFSSLNSANFKKPKKKKTNSGKGENIFLPLPIPIQYPDDKNIENISSSLPGNYTATFIDNRIYVKDEHQSKILFNFGYFGKGEFSRGEPSLNKNENSNINSKNIMQDIEDNEGYSLSLKNLVPISNEKFNLKKTWSNISSINSNSDDFNNQFMKEFKKVKIDSTTKHDQNKYFKVKYEDKLNETDLISLSNHEIKQIEQGTELSSSLFKVPNDPFCFKIKKMPQTVLNEALNLMHEEAFFLSFGLGCLNIFCEIENRNLDNLELWERFLKFDSDFPFKYAVYHKLRSKGWILKNGIKYGCDFLAYYEGPDRHHASYSIRVKRKDLKDLQEEFDTDLSESKNENLEDDHFTQFSALIRINETVSKEVMLCYVIYDTTSDEVNFARPSCLKQMSILDVLVNRWIPQENRDNNDEKPSSSSSSSSTNKKNDTSSINTYFKSLNDLDSGDD